MATEHAAPPAEFVYDREALEDAYEPGSYKLFDQLDRLGDI